MKSSKKNAEAEAKEWNPRSLLYQSDSWSTKKSAIGYGLFFLLLFHPLFLLVAQGAISIPTCLGLFGVFLLGFQTLIGGMGSLWVTQTPLELRADTEGLLGNAIWRVGPLEIPRPISIPWDEIRSVDRHSPLWARFMRFHQSNKVGYQKQVEVGTVRLTTTEGQRFELPAGLAGKSPKKNYFDFLQALLDATDHPRIERLVKEARVEE